MQYRNATWRDWVFGGICACLIAAAILAIFPGWPAVGEVLESDAAPAWVQALGSVAAIVAAVWVMHAQNEKSLRLALEMEERRSKRRHNAVVGIAMFARFEVRRAATFIEQCAGGQAADPPRLDMLAYAERELASITIADVESYYLGAGVRQLLSCVRAITVVCTNLRAVDDPSYARQQTSAAADLLQATEQAFEDIAVKAWKELTEDPRIALPW